MSAVLCLSSARRVPTQRHQLLLWLSKLRWKRHQPLAFSTSSAGANTQPTISAPHVISRRAWQAYKRKHPSLYSGPSPKTASETAKAKKDDSSWPKSVIYTGYALAGTFIPYISVWVALSNDTLRPGFLQCLPSEKVEAALRRHFGTPEWDAVPYPDQIAKSPKPEIPHTLMGELSAKERQNQARIEADAYGNVLVRVQVVDSDSKDIVADETRSMPCSVLANLRLLGGGGNQENVTSGTHSLALEFPLNPNDDASGDSMSVAGGLNAVEEEEASSKPAKDPLRNQVNVFSLWHYQPVAPVAAGGKEDVSFHVSEQEIQKAQLQNEIQQLEQELRSGTSPRSVDEIVADLDSKRQRLKMMEWKKWIPW